MSDTAAVKAQSALDASEDPVFATFDAQEIGRCVARRMTPAEFNQHILLALRQNGAPIEGAEGFLRPARGVVCKARTSPRGQGYFTYCWLPDDAWAAVKGYREEAGFEAYAGEGTTVN